MAIDWTKPIEAIHTDGRVVPVSVKGGGRLVFRSMDTHWTCYRDNPPEGWTIRNVAPTGPNGMDLRDWFAGQALAGMLSDNATVERHSQLTKQNPDVGLRNMTAKIAYEYADAMMQERSK